MISPTPKQKQEQYQYQDLMIRTFSLSNAKAKDGFVLLKNRLDSKLMHANEQLNATAFRDQPKNPQLTEMTILANGRPMTGSLIVHTIFLASVEKQRMAVQAEWTGARQRLVQHMEAKKVRQDVHQVKAMLPAQRDFAPLALGVTDEAKRDHVTLPALSYRTEATGVPGTIKAILLGPVSGRYEDLRRFMYHLETAEELLFIEDLDLVRSGDSHDDRLTFNIKIAIYLREEAGGDAVPRTR